MSLLTVITILIIIAGLVQPINNDPLAEQDYYKQTVKILDDLLISNDPAEHPLQVGWGKANITPPAAAMAGYKPRRSYSSILDSLYCRVITISNGGVNVSLISLDLLITPPAVRKKVEQLLEKNSISTLPYFSAVHTHNGIGNWDASLAGNVITGKYEAEIVNMIAQKIINAITASLVNFQNSSISYYKVPAPAHVYNRMNANAKTDNFLRGLLITRADGSTGYLVTYAAHPTSLPMKSTYLSADYPGRLVTKLEQSSDFAMFMAGMVGSHGLTGVTADSIEKIDLTGEMLGNIILRTDSLRELDSSATIQYKQIKLPLHHARLRLMGRWQLRDWVFKQAFGPLQASITLVKIDDLVMLSMPGDFSGELYQNYIAGKHPELHVIITSFNGNFIGYIIDDRHYQTSKKEEANVMNWLGPHGGEYFVEITNRILKILSPE